MEEDTSVKKFKKVKSKSFIEEQISTDKSKANKSFDFASLHSKARKERAPGDTPKRVHKKHKEKLDGSDNNEASATSTPKLNTEKHKSLKSIMKNTSMVDESEESYTPDYYANKRKKRNKSVSFVLEDESASKKSKPDDSLENLKSRGKAPKSPVEEKVRKKERKNKKMDNGISEQAEKENVNENNKSANKTSKDQTKDDEPLAPDSTVDDANNNTEKPTKKKFKKNKKAKHDDKEKPDTDANTDTKEVNSTIETTDTVKKSKQKKREPKRSNSLDDGEPKTKTRKQVTEATTISEDLENLNIGDNPHTITKVTDLLDEMTVANKNKNKKNKSGKEKKGKAGKDNKKPKTIVSSTDVVETLDLENIEEGKEKIKWKNRKWNKDKKVVTRDDYLSTSVIVDNLPLKIMLNYKKLLIEHFSSCGAIKGIGIAEVYPTEEPKPVFTTTVHFAEESAATKALEEDNTSFEGSRIRVKRPLPPTTTTLVVRSYAELSVQSLSSAFIGAGRIRNIRLTLKGRKTICTAFVEFDGPQSVERALKMAEDARIGGKKIHATVFEVRSRESSKEKNGKDGNPDDE